jgi:hypothetical protein
VRGAKSGDRKSLEDLFARYLPKVRRIVALRLGCTLRDFAAYEDMVQEGLLRAFEKLEQFQELSEGGFYKLDFYVRRERHEPPVPKAGCREARRGAREAVCGLR